MMVKQKKQYLLQCMRRFVVTLTLLYLVTLSTIVLANDYGRYQAIVMYEGGHSGQSRMSQKKVFIIDSTEGHMWTWEEKTKIRGTQGEFALGTVLTYQGQVKPGKEMGEIVEQSLSK